VRKYYDRMSSQTDKHQKQHQKGNRGSAFFMFPTHSNAHVDLHTIYTYVNTRNVHYGQRDFLTNKNEFAMPISTRVG
jgi:hypothetical protein